MAKRSWRIGPTEICFKEDLESGETAHPFVLSGSHLFRDPFTRRTFGELYRKMTGRELPDVANASVAQSTLTFFQQAFRSGAIVAVWKKAEGSTSKEGDKPPKSSSGPGSSSGGAGKSSASSSTSEKTWVDVQLVDDDGEPVPGAHYRLKITDGSTREGTLDSSGRVRVNNVDPGNCTVWFPDYDGSEWKKIA